MKQEDQQITQKPALPIKTKIAAWKIAAWWMIITSGLFMFIALRTAIFAYFELFPAASSTSDGLGALFGLGIAIGFMLMALFLFFLFLIFFFIGIFILKRKRLAWWISIILLPIIILISISPFGFPAISFIMNIFGNFGLTIFLIFYFFPLSLLLLDRKNFWKIAT